eukprot:453070_1
MQIQSPYNTKITTNNIMQKCIVTVDAFVNTICRICQTNLPKDIRILITMMYAKPITMNLQYNDANKWDTNKCVLFCVMTDTWKSVVKKIADAYSISRFCIHRLEYSGVYANESNWESCRWSDRDAFHFAYFTNYVKKRNDAPDIPKDLKGFKRIDHGLRLYY